MGGVGLVLAGGGGRGSYQIGVWKALREAKYDRDITAVSGTSVGALNAALFMNGEYDLAEKIWLNISNKDMFTWRHENIRKIAKILIKFGITKQIAYMIAPRMFIAGPTGIVISILSNILTVSQVSELLYEIDWSFTRDGMIKLMSNYIDMNHISCSPIIGYASCSVSTNRRHLSHDSSTTKVSVTYFRLNNCDPKRIESVLLASSAIPKIYPAEIIDGRWFVDGAREDNVPISPLYDMGYRTFIVVHLDREDKIDKSQFPGCSFIEIVPQNINFGLGKGLIDFNKKNVKRRIEQGQKDAIEVLNLSRRAKTRNNYSSF